MKKYENKASNDLFKNVAQKNDSKAKVTVLRMIPDEKLVDYPGNNEDVSYTADIERSIEERGFTDPLEVTTFGQPEGCYMILSGHRRRRAGRNKGMTEFPCLVKDHLTSEHEVEGYVRMANAGRNGESDPLLYVNRCINMANFLKKEKAAGRFKGSIREEIAVRMNLSIPQVDRNLKMERVINPILDMIRSGVVGISSVVPIGTHPENVQEAMQGIMNEALLAGVELTRDVVKRIVDGYEAGKRTWGAIAANPEQTKDSGLPLTSFINPDPGKPPKEEVPGNRNNEVNRERDYIAEEYDSIEADRKRYEEEQREQAENAEENGGGVVEEVSETETEEKPDKEPKPTPPKLTEEEERQDRGKKVLAAVGKLNTLMGDFFEYNDSEEAEKAIETLRAHISNCMEAIKDIAKAHRLNEAAMDALGRCYEDCEVYMSSVK